MTIREDTLITTIENIIDNLEDEDYKEFNVTSIAKKCNVENYQLSKEYKRKKGSLVKDFMFHVRMYKAYELLRLQKHLSVSCISEMLGYDNIEYFSKLFKRTFRKNPSEIKKY